MSAASDRAKAKDATTRGRSSSNGSRNAKSSSSASARARNSSARAKNNSSRSSRSPARKSQSSSQPAQSPEQRDQTGRQVWTNAGISALTAAIGVAGGVVLGRSTVRKDRRVLGVPVPDKIDLGGIGQQIGNAGRQFGKLAGEVRTVREKAEQVGRILT